MATKVILKIQGNLYDLWEVRSLEKDDIYNDITEQLDPCIVMNRRAIATNFQQVVFRYESTEARDADLQRIDEQFEDYEGAVVLRP